MEVFNKDGEPTPEEETPEEEESEEEETPPDLGINVGEEVGLGEAIS